MKMSGAACVFALLIGCQGSFLRTDPADASIAKQGLRGKRFDTLTTVAAAKNAEVAKTDIDDVHTAGRSNASTIRDHVLYQETFDTLPVGWEWCPAMSGSTGLVASGGASGSGHALRVSYKPYPRGTDRLVKKVSISQCLSAVLSYDVFFEPDFEWVRGGKLGAGLFGGKGTTGCRPIVPDGFSARLMWRANGQVMMYLYHQNRKERCGDNFLAMNGAVPFQLKKGTWYRITLSITMNSPPEASNGKAELYIDGVSRSLVTGLQWRKDGKANIDTFGLSTFYGGSDAKWSPSKTTHAKYDNFVVTSVNVVEPYCSHGIKNGRYCCSSFCGKCGGSGCNKRPGGSQHCCSGTIRKSKKVCSTSKDTACIIPS